MKSKLTPCLRSHPCNQLSHWDHNNLFWVWKCSWNLHCLSTVGIFLCRDAKSTGRSEHASALFLQFPSKPDFLLFRRLSLCYWQCPEWYSGRDHCLFIWYTSTSRYKHYDNIPWPWWWQGRWIFVNTEVKVGSNFTTSFLIAGRGQALSSQIFKELYHQLSILLLQYLFRSLFATVLSIIF